MISFGSLPIKQSLFGELAIAPAPTYSLPKYIIPGNILVIPVGPLGSWDLRVRKFAAMGFSPPPQPLIVSSLPLPIPVPIPPGPLGSWDLRVRKFAAIDTRPPQALPEMIGGFGEPRQYLGMDFDCELIVLPSNGSFSAKFVDKSSFVTLLPKTLTDINFSYVSGRINILFGKGGTGGNAWESIGDLRITGNTISGEFMMGVMPSGPGGVYEVTGKKRPVELFVPLTTETVVPSIVSGLTIVEVGSQILIEQGADRRAVIAAPLNPASYIPPGNLMVIPINIPHGLWKISYVVGGVTNQGQLEIADFGGQLIGRMNVSGGMLYGSSGWEPISRVSRGPGKSFEFTRDYTRQLWKAWIEESTGSTLTGIYGGGPSAGGGTWTGEKQPIEIFIPTDITKYTEKIVVTKEMPLATLIPIETVSGKPTGKVLIEEGFAPTREEALVLKEQITSVSQAVPIALAATKELLPTAQNSSLKLTLSEGGFQEILKKGLSGWGLLVLGGVGVLLFLGSGKEMGIEKKRGRRR